MSDDQLDILKRRLRQFAAMRDWESMHSPNNLAMALNTAGSDLLKHFLWNASGQEGLNEKQQRALRADLGETLIYLIRLADKLNIDLLAAGNEQLEINEKRFPAATED